MITHIYVIFDQQANAATHPIFSQEDGFVIREFVRAVSGGDKKMTDFKEDYTLFEVGTYDDEAMLFEATPPRRVISGIEAQKKSLMEDEEVTKLRQQIEALQDQVIEITKE